MKRLHVGVDLRCLQRKQIRGLSRYTLEIVNALARSPSIRLTGIAREALPFDIPFEVQLLCSPREIIAEQIELAAVAYRLKFDVLFCPANRGLPLFSPCPTVLTLHDTTEWKPHLVGPSSFRSAFRMNYSTIASLASATSVITVSMASAHDIVDRLGISRQHIHVIYEGASERFGQRDERDSKKVLAKHGLDPGFILYVGGFDEKKNVATLLESRARMRRDLAPLVLAGPITQEVRDLKGLSTRLGTEGTVRFIGAIDDAELPRLYQAAACLSYPALAEGFGLPVVEAMTAGIPVVVADAGSLPEIVGSGGQLFRARDSAGLAVLITDLLVDAVHASSWAAAASARATAFSWETAGDLTEEVLTAAAVIPASQVWTGRLAQMTRSRQRLLPKRHDPLIADFYS